MEKITELKTMQNNINILEISDELAKCSIQLDNIAELIEINLTISKLKDCDELTRIYFLTDYIKQLSSKLDNFSNEIIKDDAKWPRQLTEYQQAKH